MRQHFRVAFAALILVLAAGAGLPAAAATYPTPLPVLWNAGGLNAGSTGAGQAAVITADTAGNVAVVSGPSGGRDLAITSYTSDGTFRWRRTVSPASGTFAGDWIVAAPNGDFVTVGHNRDSHGRSIASTMVRHASDGTFLWRVDLAGTFPQVGRLVVDAAGNEYLVFSAVGSGMFVLKYSPAGALLWSQGNSVGGGFAVATSLALSADGSVVVATGDVSGGATWITAAYDTATGARRWLVAAPEGIAARDVVVDATRVYVTGQGNVGITLFLTVVAYDRATGARLWRTDSSPPTNASGAIGLRIALAPDGSVVTAGMAGVYSDWWIVAMNPTGTVKWQVRRDRRADWDEVPAALFVSADGTAVVSGPGGPALPGGYVQGATVGYSSNGTLLWEGFSKLATTWAVPLPNGDVCATGGYDALITCWRVPSAAGTPAVAIGDVALTEGDSGTKTALFTITLSHASASTVKVNYATVNGTATAGSDYVARTGVATFAPGTSLVRHVAVTVNGDTMIEPDESFVVNLSGAVGATITNSPGIGTIVNDD